MSKEVSRASWNYDYEKGLVDILHEHMHEKFRSQNGWKSEGWKSIVKKFNEKFPSAGFNKAKIQDKEKELKASYRALRDARRNSGAGWNDTLCTIRATESEWESVYKDNHILKKFRKKGFPLYYSMEKLYEGSIATGDLNFTSTEEPNLVPASPTENDDIDDLTIDQNPFASNLEVTKLSKDPINLDDVSPATSACSGKNGDGPGKKRKQSQVAGVLQEYVDFRKKQTIIFEDDLNREAKDRETKPQDGYSIKNCVAVLESIEELSDAEKAKATKIFKCEQNREIFLNFKSPNVRLLWIQGEIAP